MMFKPMPLAPNLRKMIRKGLRILVYDIETSPVFFDGFSLGKQVVRHNQLFGGYFSRTHIICITYQFLGTNEKGILTWGEEILDEYAMLTSFIDLINSADVIIGKNNKRFDDKHITASMMWNQVEGYDLSWLMRSSDLEQQMRKYFKMQSYSLDYYSEQLGLGGKIKMFYSDWQAIAYKRLALMLLNGGGCSDTISNMCDILFGKDIDAILKEGDVAEDKMFKYGMKDATDTCKLIAHTSNYCEFQFARFSPDFDRGSCKECGGKIRKNGKHRSRAGVLYQNYICSSCSKYAGKQAIREEGLKLS